MKRRLFTATTIGIIFLSPGTCVLSGMMQSESQSSSLSRLLDDYFESRLKLFPLEATAIGDHRYDSIFPDYISTEHKMAEKALYERCAASLRGLSRDGLSDDERLSYDVFKYELEMLLQGLEVLDDQAGVVTDRLIPVNQFSSMTLTFAQLGSGRGDQPFQTVKDYENFLSRVDGFVAWADTAVRNMRKGMAERILPPRVLMERVLPQLQAMLADDLKRSIFYQPVAAMPGEFSGEDKARLTRQYTGAIREKVIPAYRTLYDFIKTEYLPACTETSGASSLPGGKRRYSYFVKYWATTDQTPDQIFELGMSEVRRIRAEMERVRQQVGFKGDLKSFFEHLRNDSRFHPFSTEEQVLNAYRGIEAKLQTALPKYFGMVPRAKFEVRATESFRAASASEEYNRPSADGARPGIFYVPVPNPARYESTRMESLFLHEAIPGHHYQISLQQERPSLPKFRKFGHVSAFSEGWALYTEGLGKELGLYTDPYQYFGMLNQEMHRAVRLVVDTGIHAKGWTREQAIQFSLDNEGLSKDRIMAEVERYMAWPGQALSYKIGQLKILELRRRAEKELGKRFSIKAFHDEILRDGSLPLSILETKMANWIARQP
ncbi:MAG TPA: DUF885 domain-containing protein [Blastocatellia bacterium]|nr:DUF885 domain-containing protein [Blastocatellia bacterium]